MQEIRVRQDFAHPPETLWRYLIDHEGLIRWAPIQSVTVLRPAADGGAGCRRRLEAELMPGLSRSFDEEVTLARAPERFEYRVIAGLPFRHHYGIIDLHPIGEGTRLIWRIRFELAIPFLGRLLRQRLEDDLKASLQRLNQLVRAEYTVSDRALRGRLLEDSSEKGAWHLRARERCDRLRRTAIRFKKQGSEHYWFARVYQRVQESLLALVEEGHFIHPDWVLRLCVRLHEIYEGNMNLWESGRRAEVEFHWSGAFEAAELGGKWWRKGADASYHALGAAVRVHIREDLPRALATIYRDYYEPEPELDPRVFLEDFIRVQPIFEAARRLLARELPPTSLTRKVAKQLTPKALRALLFEDPPTEIALECRRAWLRGLQLLKLLQDPDGARGLRFPESLPDRHRVTTEE